MLQRFQLLIFPMPTAGSGGPLAAQGGAGKCLRGLREAGGTLAWGAAPADEFAKFLHFCFAQAVFIEWSGDMHRARNPNEDEPIHPAASGEIRQAVSGAGSDCAAQGISGPIGSTGSLGLAQ